MESLPTTAVVDPDLCAGGPSHPEWWRRLFDQAEDAQLVCSPRHDILAANRVAAQLFGPLERRTACEDFFRHTLLPDTIACLESLLQREDGLSRTLRGIVVQYRDRAPLLVDFRVTPLGDGHSLITVRDASRRSRLETHAQRLIAAVDSTTDVVFLLNAEGRLTFVNAAFHHATGYSIEDVLGRGTEFLRAPADQPRVAEYVARVRAGHEWTGELLNQRRDESVYPVAATLSPIFDGNGTFIGAVGFERDITARKQLEDELRSGRNLVRSIINSLDSAVYTVDRDFRLTHFNEAWRSFPAAHGWLDLQAAPQTGRSLLDYAADDEKRSLLQAVFACVLAEGRPREMRVTAGGRQWLMNVVPWRHEQETRGLIYRVTDHTQHAELQKQLYQMQKMETIGALAAGIAHDFNNLLQAIRGNISLLLLNKGIASDVTARLNQVDDAAGRAEKITQQLLAFSRASDETAAVVDFNELIAEAGHLARRTLRGRVMLQLEPAPQPVKVQIDPTRAQQVLLNLCVNAQDAMPEGGTLTLTNAIVPLNSSQAEKARAPAGSKFVRCSVADTGTGIPPEVLSRIFDPFFTTKEKGKGTGLGLAIVHSVTNNAGGFVEVQSAPGRGTTFHLFFPFAHGALTPDTRRVEKKLSKGSGTVLVVDDLDLVLDFARAFLETAGYRVLTANSADAALKTLADEGPKIDLLLTDYSMPGKSGLQLLREARPQWPHLRLVLASGFLEESERRQIERDFGARILLKPYSISDATNLIRELLLAKA